MPGRAGAAKSKQRLGLLEGPRGSQGLEAQQPDRWHGVGRVAGGLVKEKGEQPPQQRAARLQHQRGQAQRHGDPAVPRAGPQRKAPGVMATGWGDRPGTHMVWCQGDRGCREQDGACRGGNVLGGSGSRLGANCGQAPCSGMVPLPTWHRSMVGWRV